MCMSEAFLYSLLAVTVVSAISLVGAFAIFFSKVFLRRAIFISISVAVGALLGDAFVHLIPEAFRSGSGDLFVSILIVAGIAVFFLLEKFLHWHHEHGEESPAEYEEYKVVEATHTPHAKRPLGKIILMADSFHNFLDGVIIAASFIVSTEIGIATTIAVILHEIPHEIGDFGVLLHAGYTKARALFLNFLSALTAVAGALVTFLFGFGVETFAAYMVPFAAGGFIYIASADLIPELHKTTRVRESLIQISAIMVGFGSMLLLLLLE